MPSLIQFSKAALRPGKSSRHHSGFTMIEVLVTIVVVSIGLLGLAGLQINGLRANMSSEARSKATLLANDIVERMRANPLGVDNNAYGAITINADSCTVPETLCGNTSAADTTATCSATEMAIFDAWEWGCGSAASGVQGGGVTSQLPNGTASVTCNDSPCISGSAHTVTVSWNELTPSATGASTAGTDTVQAITLVIAP
jgi:type IV pilus assembly protein PilV